MSYKDRKSRLLNYDYGDLDVLLKIAVVSIIITIASLIWMTHGGPWWIFPVPIVGFLAAAVSGIWAACEMGNAIFGGRDSSSSSA